MYPKISNIFFKLPITFLLLASLILAAGCSQNNRSRLGKTILRSGLGIQSSSARTVYVLSYVQSANSGSTQNVLTAAQGARTRDGLAAVQTTNNIATGMPGLYGHISVVSVKDSTQLSADRTQGVIPFNPVLRNYSAGISGYMTSSYNDITGVTDQSFIGVFPDPNSPGLSSLLVSCPETKSIVQLFLNESGIIEGQQPIPLHDAIPTRFVGTHDFQTKPYVFVATNRGVLTLGFLTPNVFKNYTGVRVIGSTQKAGGVPGNINPSSSPPVSDIAISPNDEGVYVSTSYGQIQYKSMDVLTSRRPMADLYPIGFRADRLATPSTVIDTFSADSVAALGASGVSMIDGLIPDNRADNSFVWNRLGPYKPVDFDFHPDGTSLLILTDSLLWMASLRLSQIGMDLQSIGLNGTGARAMSVDKRFKSFVAVAMKGFVSFYPLDPGGTVSPNGPNDMVSIPGNLISVAIR